MKGFGMNVALQTTDELNSQAPAATSREWTGLFVLSIACLLYSMDLSVLFLAIPSITRELQPTPTELLWINDVYGFMVAGFLVTMGTLGDIYGRRKILLIGAAAFGAASLLCAFASDAKSLIAARALLGIAGATIAPSTLSLLFSMFKREDERTQAMGIWGTAFALGGLLGPVVGGVLLNWFHWGSVFLINVPIMLALIVIGPRILPEYKNEKAGHIDLWSVLLSLASVLTIVYALKEVAAYGWYAMALPQMLGGAMIGWLFYRRQKRIEHPLVDFELFKSARFNVILLANLAGIFFIFAIFLFQNLFFQLVLNLSPLEAGLWSVLPSLVFCVLSLKTYLITARTGQENAVIWGLALFALSAGLMAWSAWAHSLFGILGSSMLMAVGFVPVILTTTNLIVSAAPPERAGAASALSETCAEFGGALGVGLLGSLVTFIYRARMAATEAPAKAKATLGDAVDIAGTTKPDWLMTAQDAFATGFAVSCIVAMIGLALLSALAWRVLGKRAV
jgi:MFS transporter, DHA2 family, multidrug resistance protein